MAGRAKPGLGSGGMATKIAAARIAVSAGCHMGIASGHQRHPIRRIEAGARLKSQRASGQRRRIRRERG